MVFQSDREVRVVTDDRDYYMIVKVSKKTAQRVANSLAGGSVSEEKFAASVENAVNLVAVADELGRVKL